MKKSHLFLALLIMLIWGCNYSVIKLGLDTLDPFMLTALRFLLCAIPLIFFLKRPKGHMSACILYGVIFGIGLWGVVNLGIFLGISPGLASLLLQISAILTVLWGVIFLNESFTRIKYLGMVFILTGLLIIIFSTPGKTSLLSIGLILFGAFSWSLCNLIIKKNKPENLLSFMTWSSLFSALPLFILTYLVKGSTPFLHLAHDLTAQAVFSIFFQAYITTIFGYGAWSFLLKKYPVSQVAPLSLLIPIFGFLSAYWLFHETLSPIKIISVLIILLGLGIFLFPIKKLKSIFSILPK